jgi:ornithine cyclodeaminase
MKIVLAGHEQVTKLLSMNECIQAMEEMFRDGAMGKTKLEKRSIAQIPYAEGVLMMMPAFHKSATSAKIMTIYPANSGTRYETHQGAILLFDVEHGRLLAIVDSTSITSMRTAAVSAVATKALARTDASKLAILGSGALAASHLSAIPLVREIEEIRVWSRNLEHAKSLVQRSGMRNIRCVDTAREAVEDSDIICTVTSSTQPILEGKWIRKGSHINAVGAYTPGSRELDSEAVKRSLMFVDNRESAYVEAGDFLIPRSEGVVSDSHIVGELGEVLVEKVSGRTEEGQITLFKSLGLATEDLAAAKKVYTKALLETNVWFDFAKERDINH